MKIKNGSYTVILKSGKHITFKVETCRKGNLTDKIIISYRTKMSNRLLYKGFGFVDGKLVHFWKRFKELHSTEFIARLQHAIRILQSDVYAAGKAYALETGNCFVCHRELTNPESIEAGIGPECRRKFFM